MEQGSTASKTGAAPVQNPSEANPSTVVKKAAALEQSLKDTAQEATSAVTDTAHDAASAVTDTVDAVKDAVSSTVAQVKGVVRGAFASVRRVFDLPHHVRHYPWLMVGGAVVMGYMVSNLIRRRRR